MYLWVLLCLDIWLLQGVLITAPSSTVHEA